MELFDLVRAAMARRSIPSCDRRRSAIGRVTDPPRGDENRSATSELPSIFATSATDRFPKVAGPIQASGSNGARLGNYADPKVVNAARMKYDLREPERAQSIALTSSSSALGNSKQPS
jgi:hypothetical protein